MKLFLFALPLTLLAFWTLRAPEKTEPWPELTPTNAVTKTLSLAPVLKLLPVKFSAEPSLPPLDPRAATARWEKIESLFRCERDSSCPLPNRDSRESQFALRDALLLEAEWFLAFRPGSPEQEERSARAAARLLEYPDEQVQAVALLWISRLPLSAETVPLLKENLSDAVDPDLTHLLMLELSRHLGTSEESAALSLAENLLLEGGIFASREVARSLHLLVNKNTRSRVEGWVEELPPQSSKVRLARESLKRVGI